MNWKKPKKVFQRTMLKGLNSMYSRDDSSIGLKLTIKILNINSYDTENHHDLNKLKRFFGEVSKGHMHWDIDVDSYIESGEKFSLLAEPKNDRNNNICGGVFCTTAIDHIKIDYLYVTGAHRYQGVGTKLLLAVLEMALLLGKKHIELEDGSDALMPWMFECKKRIAQPKIGNFYNKSGGSRRVNKIIYPLNDKNIKIIQKLFNNITDRYL